MRLFLIWTFLYLLFSSTSVKAQTAFYISPSGKATNTGSISSPWDLQTALNQPTTVKPGSTLYLRAGVYGTGGSTQFSSKLTGSSTVPITLTAYQNEHPIINGSLIINNSYSTYQNLEITNTDTDRVSTQTGSFPTDISRKSGILVYGSYTRLIDNVVHDTKNGIEVWTAAENVETTGNIVFNNGWQGPDRGHGHGIYTQNQNGLKTFKHNIVLNNFSDYSLHAYTESGYIRNFIFDGNVSINDEWLIGGLQPASSIVMQNNFLIKSRGKIGYKETSVDNVNISLMNNVFLQDTADCLLMNRWQQVTFTNNFLSCGSGNLIALIYPATHNPYSWNANTYSSTKSSPFTLAGASKIFSTWKTSTGFDSTSQFTTLNSEQRIWYQTHTGDVKSGVIIIANPSKLAEASIDLTRLGVIVGETYEIRSVQNYYGDTPLVGTYANNLVKIPLTATRWTVAKPIGWAEVLSPNTLPNYGIFEIRITGRSIISPTPVPPVIIGDTNFDQVVDFRDVYIAVTHYGQTGGVSEGNVNDDSLVNIKDVNIIMTQL